MASRALVGRTPWSAADALVGLPRRCKNLVLRTKNGSRGTRADEGVRPTISGKILLLVMLLMACAPLVSAADQLTGFPFQNETLHYRVKLPGGSSLGDVTLTAHKTGDSGWDFDMSATVGVPVVPISDTYKSTAGGGDLCSSTLRREISHGTKTVVEKTEFDQQANQAQRQTVVPAGGGKSEFSIPTCGRDALTFLYFARREMGQGRVAPAGKVFFGSGYEVKMVYTGAMDIPAAGKPVVTDHVNVSVKGPASDFTFEIFYLRDAARTPLEVKIPVLKPAGISTVPDVKTVGVGTVTLELVR
jgi:hypothetical protein